MKKTTFSEYDKSRRDGFIAINLRDDDELVRVIRTSGTEDIFLVSRNGTTLRFSEEEVRPTGRAAQGVIGMRLRQGDEVVLISSAGVTIRLPVRAISSQGRDATGVRVMNLEAGQMVASVAPILASDDDD